MDSAPKTRLGLVLYTAPEVVACQPGMTYSGEAADVWSLGVLLSLMVFGQHPFLAAASEPLPGRAGEDDSKSQAVVRVSGVGGAAQGSLGSWPTGS